MGTYTWKQWCGILSRSTDGGATFENATNIGNNTGFNGFPQIAVSGNKVYLVWHDASKGILFTRSTDSGASFESVRQHRK